MPKSPNRTEPKKNTTEERLRATPFESIADLDKECKAIRLMVWRKFAEAQVINEMMTKQESKFIHEEWKAGLVAYYGNGADQEIFRIYSDGKGLKLEINRKFVSHLGDNEAKFISSIVQSSIEGYGFLYMKAKALLSDSDATLLTAKVDPAKKESPR